jgi:hypothetical protein
MAPRGKVSVEEAAPAVNATKPTDNDVLVDSATIKKLQHDLDKARRDLKRLEMREQSTEQSTSEALEEFQKLKSLIFGDGDLPIFQTSSYAEKSVSSQQVTPAQVSPPPAKGTSQMSTGRLSLGYPSCDNEITPTEIVIMKQPLQTPPHVDLNAARLQDAEQRVAFLKTKLYATHDLVESLFQDVESARGCIHKLVFKNVALSNRVEQLKIELESSSAEAQSQKMQQYLLLKYSVYGGLFFFVFGYHDFYFGATIFLWLCLEALTQCK